MGAILFDVNNRKNLILQFIYHPAISSIHSYLMAFDFDVAQSSFNGDQVYCTWAAIRAMTTGTFVCYCLTTEFQKLARTAIRLRKYCERNFTFLYPIHFPMDRFLRYSTSQCDITNSDDYPSSDPQFGRNNDYFQLQKHFVQTYLKHSFR
jgi:hypothetical protein